jgi:hypothetical protein
MNLKTVVLSATLLLGVSVGAHAQAGVYGMISTERLTNVNCLADAIQTVPTSCSSNDRIDRATGAGGGVYYDFMKLGRVKLGADVRGSIQKSNKSASTTIAGTNALRMDEAMGGVRASFSFHKNELKPYAEGAIGWSQRSSGQGLANADFLAYRAYFGLDIAVLPFMDVRLPEVAIGQNIGRNGVSSNTVESGSIGVVFHLPSR